MSASSARSGVTLVELVIGLFLAMAVVLAMGRLILVNQRQWQLGRDKAVLQQNLTETLEWLARAVRAADSLAVVSATEFATYEDGAEIHRFALVAAGGENRLRRDGLDLVDRRCTAFQVTPNEDTTSLILRLELEDGAASRMTLMTVATPRNRSFEF
ncbi:MAG: hypothetical protein FJY75_07590 [Candidatus Eisenbacteria bacterium]|uniref:Prepilin-type N-terminal cleavage/methylation domain-containing protein n=1 Tax=Eiseniibacteriota bacterium TaxID=2212470 RepID=A0A938BQW4_UNCEI|nr:hypothetical protein [Candidatus Eisenbacteria bacterium]